MESFKYGVVKFPDNEPFILFTEYEHARDFAYINRSNGMLNIVELIDDEWRLYIIWNLN